MKNRTRLAATFFGLLGCSLAILATPTVAEDRKAILIDASGENFAIDGNDFPVGPAVDALVRLWGEPDRIRKGVNHVRIWDDLGIRAYSSPASPSVESLTFTFKKQEKETAAKEVFTGKIKAPKGTLTGESTSADLKKLGFTENASLSKFYDLDTLMFSFFAEVDEDAGGELVELSLKVGLGF